MPLILICALIIPPVLALAHFCKKSSVHTMPLYLLSIAAFLYVSGLFGIISAGVWAVRAAWLLSAAALLYALIKKQINIVWLLKQAAVPLLLLALCWWLCRGRSFSNWDEFSHWGIALKGLFYENVLPSVSSLRDGFKNYPPIVAVLQYGVSKAVTLSYREDIVLFIQAVFASSLLAYPVSAVKSVFGKASALAAMLLTPLILYPNFYYETTMDGILGVMFGFVLVLYLLRENTKFDYALLCLSSFALCLTKTTGILFFAFILIIILTDTLLNAKKSVFSIKAFMPLIVSSSGALFAQGSWVLHLNINNVTQRWADSSFSLSALTNLIFKGEPQYRADTVNNFFKNIVLDFNYGSFMKFPFVFWLALFALAAFLLLRFAKKYLPKASARILWLLCAGAALYTLLTLGTYLFSFAEFEAVNVSSISRYLNTFLAAQLVLIAAMSVLTLQNAKIKASAIFAACFTSIWFLLVSPAPVKVLQNLIFAPKAAAVTANNARVYEQAADIMAKASEGKPERVRLISQFDYGYSHIRLGYQLAPLTFPEAYASITVKENDENDPWSEYHTVESLQKQLYGSYDYVYIIYLNPAFTENFSSLFEDPSNITEHTLYKVIKQNGNVMLQFAEKAKV